ncbi:MAG: glycosyltransferase family 39 protein [Acidobacteriota bacterium]
MEATETITTAQPAGTKTFVMRITSYWTVTAIGFAGALVLLWRLGSGSLDDWDEAIYAQISKEAVEGGHWWTLHWGFAPYLRKPPVFMWTTAIFYEVFGVSEFWARAASAFSGIALLVVTYLIAKQIDDRWVGFAAVVILLTSYQFVASSRFGTTDIMLTFFIYLAVYGYLRVQSGDARGWYVIWISCALALMTKSAAGVIAPLAIILALFLDRRFKTAIRLPQFWRGLFMAFIIIVPWHISMVAQHGQAFIEQYISHSIVDRSVGALDQHTGDRYYYIDRLQKYFFPWVYVTPFAIALTIKEMMQGRIGARILLLIAMLNFGICLMVQTKLRWYIVPLYPALAILNASLFVQALKAYQSVAFSCLLMAVFVVALLAPLKIVLIFGITGMAVVLLAFANKKMIYRPVALMMCAFLITVGANTLKPLYQGSETPVAKLARLAGSANANHQLPVIVTSNLFKPTPLFYSDRPVEVAYSADELAQFIQQPREIILAEKDIAALSGLYKIEVIEKAAPLVYATISRLKTP